jgi:hypothetical protein
MIGFDQPDKRRCGFFLNESADEPPAQPVEKPARMKPFAERHPLIRAID